MSQRFKRAIKKKIRYLLSYQMLYLVPLLLFMHKMSIEKTENNFVGYAILYE